MSAPTAHKMACKQTPYPSDTGSVSTLRATGDDVGRLVLDAPRNGDSIAVARPSSGDMVPVSLQGAASAAGGEARTVRWQTGDTHRVTTVVIPAHNEQR